MERKETKEMGNNSSKTRQSRNRRRIRRLKRRIIRILVLSGAILLICVVVTLFGKKLLENILKDESERNPINTEESKTLNGTGEKKINKEIRETETASAEKLEEFKSRYNKEKEKFVSYTVCLDAGHGGEDTGAEGEAGSYEKDEVMKLSYLVKSYLEAVGVNVVMTRTGDETVSLEQRRNIAENCNADLLLSIHRNVYEGTEDVNGIEAWINNSRPQDAARISENILDSIEHNVRGFRNRGVKWGSMDNVNENYGVNKVSMASLILEVGFITSRHDNELFIAYLDEIARGIAAGVLDSI